MTQKTLPREARQKRRRKRGMGKMKRVTLVGYIITAFLNDTSFMVLTVSIKVQCHSVCSLNTVIFTLQKTKDSI